MKTPISLIIDDSAPMVHVYYFHVDPPLTRDGRPLLRDIPNDFLPAFCDVAERFGLRGKFSVVPNPGCRGLISREISGHSASELAFWLDTVRSRISPLFSLCPEIQTHHLAMSLTDGTPLSETELEWSNHATEREMTDYLSRALEIERDAGIAVSGFTSPWTFGLLNEKNYVRGIMNAFDRVLHIPLSWYFLHELETQPGIRPWVELQEDGKTVVAIPSTVGDGFWQTINSPDTSEDFVRKVADGYITEDGSSGAIIDALARHSYPILCTHWQSLFSNGNRTGLRALAEVARRVDRCLSSAVEWTSFDTQAALAAADNIQRPIPR